MDSAPFLADPERCPMDSSGLASIKLSEVLRPKSEGQQVNVHVVESAKEPQPDFAAMQRLISGAAERARAPDRDAEN